MSDTQQGPGWWLASDGKWYPPEQAPPVPPASEWPAADPSAATGPPPSPKSKVPLIVAGVIGVLVLLVIGLIALGGGDDDDEADDPGSTVVEEGSGESSTALPEGFETLEGDGVAIAAPEGWELVDSEDLALSGDEFAEAFPDAPEGLLEQGLGLFENGALLVAFDFGNVEFADNVNVVEVEEEAPISAIEDGAVEQLESLGGEISDSGEVETAAGDALRIAYTLDITLPDGSSTPAEGVQYYIPADGSTYIVTVSAGSGAADLADEMIGTFVIS